MKGHPSELKTDLLKSMLAPGTVTVMSANDLLKEAEAKHGRETAKIFQDLVTQKIKVSDLDESQKTCLLKFVGPRSDVISKSLTSQLEK